MRLNKLLTGTCCNGVRFFILLTFICTIVACGKKGSLYLPVEPEPVIQEQIQKTASEDLQQETNTVTTENEKESDQETKDETKEKIKEETKKESEKVIEQNPAEQ